MTEMDFTGIEARVLAWTRTPVYDLPHLPEGSWWFQCRLFRARSVPDVWPYGPTARWAENPYGNPDAWRHAVWYDETAPVPQGLWDDLAKK